jgi:pilus assembly protein CpaB
MGRLRGCLWLTAGLLVALVAGFVAFMTLNSVARQRAAGPVEGAPSVEVVTASRAVIIGSALITDDLALKTLPVNAVPEGAARELGQVVGMITLVDLYPGEVILTQRLVDPNVASASGRLALVLAQDKVLMAFPADDLMSKVGILKPGDHVDLLFSLEFPLNRTTAGAAAAGAGTQGETEQTTFNVLQNVVISAIVGPQPGAEQQTSGSPQALLLTISPQDALVLKYVKDAKGIMDIVLRAPGAEQPFTVEPVDIDYVINRYQIPTQVGR